MITIHARLRDYREDIGGYINYVFENLDSDNWTNRYMMVTRCPNWEHRELKVGETGYLTYNNVVAGKDEWFNRDTKQMILYKCTDSQFIKFIEDKKPDEKYIM